ncbi:hypothetical protein SAY86_019619 [Trapa natans]|uniref:Uncharacterized protein n=1 Tax=Trapa natans TaxID=22666 RepID=A0AAN7R4V8_TRANT|nr:hypothetical protein SAY86_019619 [Trapa natans]
MDSYRSYARAPAPPTPPSSAVDPHYHQYQQQAAALPQGPWFPNHFPPSTPPPPPWAPPPPAPPPPPPPPHSDHPPPPAYPNPSHPYPPHHAQQFPPRPYLPPPQHLNPYPPQDWGNSNWSYQQSFNHQAQSDTEDWAARAKAWASAKAAMESQHPHAHYQYQYPQATESHYVENHQNPTPGSAYQQHPPSTVPPNGQPVHFQENQSIDSRSVSYLPDGRMMYSAADGHTNTDRNAAFPAQEHLPAKQSVHQQEVPLSYSSVSGKEEVGDYNEGILPLHSSATLEGVGHIHAPISSAEGSVFSYGKQYSDPTTNPADQPLEFASRFNSESDLRAQSAYTYHDTIGHLRSVDTAVPMASGSMWTSSMTPDVAYPSIPGVFQSGSQHDPSVPIPPHASGHAIPPFPRFPGPSFQPTVSAPGGPFGLGAGLQLPPTGGFSADSYGIPGNAERPKKAPVPNWLREEIIKTKASISSSFMGHPKDEAQSNEDEGADVSFDKGDQADNKSIDSKSTEEDDDDEDYVEAARAAAINQEIKRVLTEVLLKVTDDLFDEIATKVLNEDDHSDNHSAHSLDHSVSPTSHSTPVSKAYTNTIAESKHLENEDVSEKSNFSAGGNILGLANYSSDDEDETQAPDRPNSSKTDNHMKSDSKRPPVDVKDAAGRGTLLVEVEEQEANADGGPMKSLVESKSGGSDSGNTEVNETSNLTSSKVSPKADQVNVNGKMVNNAVVSVSVETLDKKVNGNSKLEEEIDGRKLPMDGILNLESKMTDSDGNKRTSAVNSLKGPTTGTVNVDNKFDDNQRKDERHPRKEKIERNDSTDVKVHGKHGEKNKEADTRRRSGHLDIKDDRKDRERSYRDNEKSDIKRTERSRDKADDRSQHKASHDSSINRRQSSSSSSRGRNNRDNLASHERDSSDEFSDDSRRKLYSRKRNLSPSPVRSKRRQVSRSPYSKHSQRRHSPYSSLEGSRERRRSRSRSPMRRRR